MPLNVQALKDLVSSEGHRGQAKAARRLGIGRSTLSQLITSETKASRVTWRTVQRMAESAGVPFQVLWSGELPAELKTVAAEAPSNVPRGTPATAVRERSPTYGSRGLAAADAKGAFWAIERMNLALAQIAREARESLE